MESCAFTPAFTKITTLLFENRCIGFSRHRIHVLPGRKYPRLFGILFSFWPHVRLSALFVLLRLKLQDWYINRNADRRMLQSFTCKIHSKSLSTRRCMLAFPFFCSSIIYELRSTVFLSSKPLNYWMLRQVRMPQPPPPANFRLPGSNELPLLSLLDKCSHRVQNSWEIPIGCSKRCFFEKNTFLPCHHLL